MDYAKRILELKEYTGEDEVVDSIDIKYAVDSINLDKFVIGFPTLDDDNVMGGMEQGELIVLSGQRKYGKTLFAQSITSNLYSQGVKSCWFSFELPAKQFIDRFQGDLPAFVMPKKNKAYSLNWLLDRILESISKYQIQVVFIDHLHFLFDIANSRNTSLEIGQIIRWLKTLAIDLNIVIVLICHTNKIDPAAENISDINLRDSSFVSQESDCCLMIWRVKNTDNQACLKICYHRRTGCWEKVIRLVKVDGLLREATGIYE